MHKLYLSPEAKNDLAEIKKYISEDLANETAAINVVARITKRLRDCHSFWDLAHRFHLLSILNLIIGFWSAEITRHFIVMMKTLSMLTECYMADGTS
jgi:hypothetical protein